MNISSDWHIHSEASCDAACMQMADLVLEAQAQGIQDFGITDHIHTPYNLPDLAASRQAFLAVHPSPRFHFGVEVSCVSQWELDEIATGRHEKPVYGLRSGGPVGGALAIGVTAENLQTYGVEYVVGGTHWPIPRPDVPLERQAIIRDYHRQNMFLATHPLVTIVAHPWWWMDQWKNTKDAQGMFNTEPWFDSFKVVPQSMHDEFAGAVIAHGKVIEINIDAMLLNPHYPERFKLEYLDYLAFLHARGVALAIGSDCHRAHYYEIQFARAAEMLATVGIHDHDLWRLTAREGDVI